MCNMRLILINVPVSGKSSTTTDVKHTIAYCELTNFIMNQYMPICNMHYMQYIANHYMQAIICSKTIFNLFFR